VRKLLDAGRRPAQTSIVMASGPAAGRPGEVAVAGVRIDLAGLRRSRRILLVEGGSDRAALEALAGRPDLPPSPDGLGIVAMGGASSIGHFLRLFGPPGLNLPLGGLCDADHEDYVRAALRRAGLNPAASRAGLEACGFYVCTADLEDELIRAVGPAVVEQIVAACGESRPFRTFQRQPAHRGEGAGEQLHRFMGTHSGRKSRYARLLAEAVAPARVPRPLDRVLRRR
jgi:hypothetical protein